MNWYLQSGTDSDVVCSTRIRFARNLKEFSFKLQNREEVEKLENKIQEEMMNIGYGLKFLKLSNIDEITKISLVEKNIISPECALNQKQLCDILINDEENICIMINEEDHFRIQVFNSGLELENTFNLAKELEEKLDNIFHFAKNKKYGYLTACPTNVGTGMRASVMVHLPALSKTSNIQKILEVINSFGMEIRGIYGENSQASGDMYQISNKHTLGITEEEIIKNLKVITKKIVEQEREARKYLAKNSIDLEDEVYRDFGILSNCRKISSKETRKLLSNVKMGTDLGIIRELTDLQVSKIYLYTKTANLQKYCKQTLDKSQLDIKRAEVIREIINNK